MSKDEGNPDAIYSDDILNGVIDESQVGRVEEESRKAKEKAVFPLDLALDSYDPTFPGYTPSENALEFFNLMRLVQGKDFEFNTPIAHYFMVDLLLGEITNVSQFPYSKEVCETITLNRLRLGFMAARGIAKSTIIISFFGVYSAIKGKLPNGIGKVYFYLVLAASSRGGARVNALAVKSMCEDSVFLKGYFEDMRFTETESEFIRKGSGPKKDRSFLLRYQGIGTGVRGIRYGERRIDTIILDDIVLNESASYSKTIMDNLDSLIDADAVAALVGGNRGRIINVFTPFNYNDTGTKRVINGSYTPCVIPIAKDFDMSGDRVNPKDITSSWEAMHPAVSIAAMIRDARLGSSMKSLLQERFLRLSSEDQRLVPDKCIQYYDVRNVVKNVWAYNVYITTDYTTTSGEGSDFSGIAAWALSNNGDWFLLDLVLKKMGMKEQYTRTLEIAAKYKRLGKNVEIGVELDGGQGAHVYSLEQEMMKRADYYTFARDKNNPRSDRKGIISRSSGVKKHERFRIAITDTLLQMKMWFPEHLKDDPDFKEFITQIKGATHTGFTRADDGPDLISMLSTAETIVPTSDSNSNPNLQLNTDAEDMWELGLDDDNEFDGGSEIF